MGNRQREIDHALVTGMKQALAIAKEKGLDALEKDIQARTRTGINPPGYYYDMDRLADRIKAWSTRRAGILFIAALRDVYGFGQERMKRLLLKVDEGIKYTQTGEATWWDYSQEIERQLGIRFIEVNGGLRIEIDEKEKTK